MVKWCAKKVLCFTFDVILFGLDVYEALQEDQRRRDDWNDIISER